MFRGRSYICVTNMKQVIFSGAVKRYTCGSFIINRPNGIFLASNSRILFRLLTFASQSVAYRVP